VVERILFDRVWNYLGHRRRPLPFRLCAPAGRALFLHEIMPREATARETGGDQGLAPGGDWPGGPFSSLVDVPAPGGVRLGAAGLVPAGFRVVLARAGRAADKGEASGSSPHILAPTSNRPLRSVTWPEW